MLDISEDNMCIVILNISTISIYTIDLYAYYSDYLCEDTRMNDKRQTKPGSFFQQGINVLKILVPYLSQMCQGFPKHCISEKPTETNRNTEGGLWEGDILQKLPHKWYEIKVSYRC